MALLVILLAIGFVIAGGIAIWRLTRVSAPGAGGKLRKTSTASPEDQAKYGWSFAGNLAHWLPFAGMLKLGEAFWLFQSQEMPVGVYDRLFFFHPWFFEFTGGGWFGRLGNATQVALFSFGPVEVWLIWFLLLRVGPNQLRWVTNLAFWALVTLLGVVLGPEPWLPVMLGITSVFLSWPWDEKHAGFKTACATLVVLTFFWAVLFAPRYGWDWSHWAPFAEFKGWLRGLGAQLFP